MQARLGEPEGLGEGVEVMRYPNPKPSLDDSKCPLRYRVLAYNFLDALPLGKSALESRGVQLLHNPGVRNQGSHMRTHYSRSMLCTLLTEVTLPCTVCCIGAQAR